MKRASIFAGLCALVLALGGASTWEGSAVVGGSADFPDDGMYGACNSFPHNTSVVVTNLENGTSITVVITQNVDNPGVFIALSPKAASALGMRVGTAARIRAVAALSSPEASLPATRTGETADPDFNPRVFMARDKAAQAAAEGARPQANPAPAAAASPSAAQLIEEAAVSPQPAPAGSTVGSPTGSPPTETAPAAAVAVAPTPPESASRVAPPVIPPAVPPATPAATPQVASAPPVAAAQTPPAPSSEKPSAELYPLPAGASGSPGSPRPAPVNGQLPQPEGAPIPAEGNPSMHSLPSAQPVVEGGSIPQPRAPQPLHVALAEPAVAQQGATPAPTGSVSVVDLSRPALNAKAPQTALLEPELGPEELPEEDLPRVAAPSPAVPDTHLAEIDLSTLKITNTAPESIALERPSPSHPAPAVAGLGEPQATIVATGPEPGSLERPANPPGKSVPTAALQEPSSARPAATAAKPGEVIVGLEPTSPRPPAAAATSTQTAQTVPAPSKPAAVAQPGSPAQVPSEAVLVQGLAKGSYYIQLGVYGTNEALKAATRGFTAYPLAVEKIEAKNGSVLYRLYVGPLTRDESGVVLLRIRSLGFKDAFLRTGT
ncbi:MAG TPA: hypothetical protein VMC79_03545 [Rectinemataceae bacterium]|nr:hypothetical protein [Rectinemataceae bacterium]